MAGAVPLCVLLAAPYLLFVLHPGPTPATGLVALATGMAVTAAASLAVTLVLAGRLD